MRNEEFFIICFGYRKIYDFVAIGINALIRRQVYSKAKNGLKLNKAGSFKQSSVILFSSLNFGLIKVQLVFPLIFWEISAHNFPGSDIRIVFPVFLWSEVITTTDPFKTVFDFLIVSPFPSKYWTSSFIEVQANTPFHPLVLTRFPLIPNSAFRIIHFVFWLSM